MIWKIFVAALGTFAYGLLSALGGGYDFIKENVGTESGYESSAPAYTTPETAFSEVELVKVGNHTYYAKSMYALQTRKEEERKIALAEMEKADAGLDVDVYVSGFNYEFYNEHFRLYGYRMKDGVIEQEYSLNTGREENGNVTWCSHKYGLLSLIPDQSYVSTDGLKPASEFFEKVYNLAKEHEEQIFRLRKKEAIYGTYLLKTDTEGNVYYEFTINVFTTIRVNARTGALMCEHYWNGVYED